MSKLHGGIVLGKNFNEGEMLEFIGRLRKLMDAFWHCQEDLRSHTRFHILDLVGDCLIVIETNYEMNIKRGKKL